MARLSKADILHATIVNQVGAGVPVTPEQIKQLKRLAVRESSTRWLLWGAVGGVAYALFLVAFGWMLDKHIEPHDVDPDTE